MTATTDAVVQGGSAADVDAAPPPGRSSGMPPWPVALTVALAIAAVATLFAGSIPRTGIERCWKYCRR